MGVGFRTTGQYHVLDHFCRGRRTLPLILRVPLSPPEDAGKSTFRTRPRYGEVPVLPAEVISDSNNYARSGGEFHGYQEAI